MFRRAVLVEFLQIIEVQRGKDPVYCQHVEWGELVKMIQNAQFKGDNKARIETRDFQLRFLVNTHYREEKFIKYL